MAVKYRRPKGIYRLFKKHPCATLFVGEPLVPDTSMPLREATEDLCVRARLSVMNLLGIENEEENGLIRERLKTAQAE